MSHESKLIKAICKMDKQSIKINAENLAKEMNISESSANVNLKTLIDNGYLINTSYNLQTKHGPLFVQGSYELTTKIKDYKLTALKLAFLKWYPIVISTIALIVSILVAIYK